ncbi:MAG: DNA alkylation repair protein [Candidatus Marinimicrobia bacterium]|jgi:3-methyladenine DNA glycosylase AlkC|nr:DNA alkylation repair protein [Candidatus Neomarinimicrobiota bacterium]MBT3501243.1 DNA alkylation repair protein [Candidatus Neomarinimicrobiota bacterium]MBT3839524.1 DNA alkylation repair protein [Candidatus Neomarinimicrobiota bacterium]MBT3999425.1 DNA alkylation repair protein [Candidatus Neomarinimicrobiota bacterium]MBT4282491.1 DNA alkylation repair protein [Candidatus Neomarinimicrobiota bacterium]
MLPNLKIPPAPSSIQKGTPLKLLLDKEAVYQLGKNLQTVTVQFDIDTFIRDAMTGIKPLTMTERSHHIARAMRQHLPNLYSDAIALILKSLTPPLEHTEGNGLSGLFYMPHCTYISTYGLNPVYNNGVDPFKCSMDAQYELTKRFTCEFSIRAFINHHENKTLAVLYQWMKDKNPHVRRLCSEGTRPRLPWAKKLDSFVNDPSPTLPILEHLKNDQDLYVRRSVANHVGDIAKDDLPLGLELCEKWLENASKDLKWIIRHALRLPVKKGNSKAIILRHAAK